MRCETSPWLLLSVRRGIRIVVYRGDGDLKPATPATCRTSFGYFDAATNDALLVRFARALVRGGRLVLERDLMV